MRRMLPRYFLLSFISFIFFSILFQTIADAQESTPQASLQNPIVDEPTQTQIPPTPTIYMGQPLLEQQSQDNKSTPIIPTPTIYIVSTQTPTSTPSPAPETQTQQTYSTVEIPAVSPTATPTPTAIPSPQPTTQTGSVDLDALFSQYSAQYNVSAAELEKIAQCESGSNTNSNTETYAGMFQFLASTWESIRGLMGLDTDPDLRMNAADAIQTAAFMLSRGEQNAWPNCH
jgi:hypothetical protein